MSVNGVQRRVVAAAVLVGLWCGVAAVRAADYPTRPVRLIVPAPPGGTTDLLGRVVGTQLAARLGQPFVIDNRGGAGGIVGTDLLTKSPPDGHTLAIVYTPHTVLPHLQKVPYDALADVAPITLITTAPLLLVVPPALPARSVKDLVALARTQPLVYGSAGNGSGGHLSGELLKQITGMNATHVPYKGAGPAATDLVAGQLQFQFASQITTQGFIKAGRLRVIAVTSPQRAAAYPDVPTVAETLPGYTVVNWFGLVGPARLPRPLVERLHAETAQVLHVPDVRAKLTAEGSDVVADAPAAFAAFLHRDYELWRTVIRKAGWKVE